MAPKVLIIDGYALAFRAFYATAHARDVMATSKGEWTNAVYVFVNMLLKAWRERSPDYIIIALDRGKSFRHDQYPEYKANRSKVPDELRTQIGRLEQLIEAFNIPTVYCRGYEADDVMGALTVQATAQGVESVILTGDTDILQLVDEHVRVLLPRGRYGDETLYGLEEVLERYGGLTPNQLIDHKALVGDTSDNIPGLRGIGNKTAISLLQEYGTVEGIYDHLDEITSKRPHSALEGHREDALLYKDLVTIRRDVPVTLDFEQAKVGNFSRDDVVAVFQELEFHSLMNRIPAGQRGGDAKGMDVAPEAETKVELQYVTVDTVDKLAAMAAALESAMAFAFDTETTSTDPMMADLVGISMSTKPGKAWYVPVGHGRQAEKAAEDMSDLPLFAVQEAPEPVSPGEAQVSAQGELQLPLSTVVECLKPIFENAEIAKYAHNAGFDVAILKQTVGIDVGGLTFDTMIAAWVLDPTSRTLGLKPLTFNLLGIEMTPIIDLIGKGKSQITFDHVSIADATPYACADADMTLRLVGPLSEQLEALEQWKLFAELEMPMVSILTRMEMAGVQLDADYLAQMSKELDIEQRRIEQEIYKEAGHKFNIRSTKQLSEVLFDEMGLSPRGVRKTTHGYSTAVDVLNLFKNKHPIVDLILDHRQVAKLKSTYVDTLPGLINPRTGRVHTSYNQAGAVTGRLSSSNPNLQNIPIRTELGRRVRKGFVAQDGWVFLAADYSQIELRVLAHVSQDAELLDAFHRDQDVHARTAAAVYGIPIDQVTKDQRAIAKTVNFGLVYGQSAFGLSQQTELNYDEAERFIDTYFARYPGVKNWLDKTRNVAHVQGYVETLLGRRRYFPELKGTDVPRAYAGARAAAARQAINAPIQGTAADILKIAMIRLDEQLTEKEYRARMVLQVHDEVVLEVPKDEVEQVLALTRTVMESAYSLSVPLKVDIEVGENWFDMRAI